MTGPQPATESRSSKRPGADARTGVWRKIPSAIGEQTLEIRAAGLTTNNPGDAPMLPVLLDQIPPDQQIENVTADGAFDTRGLRPSDAGARQPYGGARRHHQGRQNLKHHRS